MSALDEAVALMGTEVAAYNVGTKKQPLESDPEFFVLRAKSIGLTMLKVMQQRGLDARRAEGYYKTCRTAVNGGSDEGN